jgi:hypothetical protein
MRVIHIAGQEARKNLPGNESTAELMNVKNLTSSSGAGRAKQRSS